MKRRWRFQNQENSTENLLLREGVRNIRTVARRIRGSAANAPMFYYLELDNADPGFEACFESCNLSDAVDEIEAIAKDLKIKSIYELMSTSEYNDLCPPGYEENEVPWFDPDEGITWLSKIRAHISAHPSRVENSSELLAEFKQCEGILHRAKEIGARWHFGMDI